MDWNRDGAFHCWRDSIWCKCNGTWRNTIWRERRKSYESKEFSPEIAKQIAVEKVNGVVEEIDVERMDDKGVYEIEVETNEDEEEIYIKKKTGIL